VTRVIGITPEIVAPRLVALDWGTTSLRAWLLGDDGRILESRRYGQGLLSTAAAGADRAREYKKAFDEACGDWLRANTALPAIACGMVGSAQGWQEAGYLTVPTDLVIDAAELITVHHELGGLHLVPGLRMAPHGTASGDFMRGEETQLIGILDVLPDADGPLTLVLPGTHTKWVRMDNRKVISFTTVMSGELFTLVLRHGILALTVAQDEHDAAAFARGLMAGAGDARGLPAELFGARALVLDGLLDPASVPDYVSGLIIGDEVRHQLPRHANPGRIVLCGTTDLCRRYASALRQHGVQTHIVSEDATARGLWAIASHSGLIKTDAATTSAETPDERKAIS
jgi:2-dehydro-3-deoxygalactonokinase